MSDQHGKWTIEEVEKAMQPNQKQSRGIVDGIMALCSLAFSGFSCLSAVKYLIYGDAQIGLLFVIIALLCFIVFRTYQMEN